MCNAPGFKDERGMCVPARFRLSVSMSAGHSSERVCLCDLCRSQAGGDRHLLLVQRFLLLDGGIGQGQGSFKELWSTEALRVKELRGQPPKNRSNGRRRA